MIRDDNRVYSVFSIAGESIKHGQRADLMPTVHDLHNIQLHKITICFTLLDHHASQMHSQCVTQWQTEESATKSLVTGREELLKAIRSLFSFCFFLFFCGWIQNCYARLSALGKRMSGACSTNKLCEQCGGANRLLSLGGAVVGSCRSGLRGALSHAAVRVTQPR